MSNIERIKEISWLLSVASAENLLDVPGEYVWAFPKNDFYDIRMRSKSIFSSGNSIKDPEVISYIQSLDLNKSLLNPWIVNEFEDNFVDWIKEGSRYNLENFDLYTYKGFSAGTQESFLNFYMVNRNRRFRVFKGDYWWHMDIWSKLNMNWAYIEDDDILENDVCICSCPFALTGDAHPQMHWLIEECNKKKAKLFLDFIYLPNSDGAVDLDLSAECIDEISFSFSKTFPVQCAKIAIRMKKYKPSDPMQMSNDENICNRLSAGLANEIIQQFPVDYMVSKYKDQQSFWCNLLDLKPSKVVHFALGEDYTSSGRSVEENWISPFNNQQNRYNLGMLYENPKLLYKLDFIKEKKYEYTRRNRSTV